MPSRAARAPIVASAPPGRPRSASRSWCCWGSSPPARATAALKARKRRSAWRNSASARYSASVTSRVATVARFISCHDMNCQRDRQGALLAGRARRAYIRRRRTRTQPDPPSTSRPPGPRLALGPPPRRCGRSGGRPGRRAPGAGSARHAAEPARARLRAAPRRRDDRRGRADLPLDPPRRPGARRVRHQRRRLRAGRRAGLPRAEAARYRLPRVRGATAAGGRRRGPPPGAPPPRPRLPRLSRRRAGATLARSLVAHQPLHLALHQGGQPARARRRRVRRAGPRLARGPRAAQLPPERGRDPAPRSPCSGTCCTASAGQTSSTAESSRASSTASRRCTEMADGAGARRLAFLDACRALAVLGMLFANMMNVFLRRVPEVLQHNEGDVLRAFDFPAPVFQFLIGVSLVLFLHKRRTGGLTPSRARLTAARRFVLLIGLGIVLDSAPALLPMLRLTEGPRWGVLQTLGLGGVVGAGAAGRADGAG